MSTISTMLAAYALTAVVSMAVAALIKVMTTVLASRQGNTVVKPAAAVAPAARPASVPAAGTEGEIAAIAAALYAALGSSAVRIVRIEANDRSVMWTAGGRMMHQTSHAITRRRPTHAT